MSNNPSRYRYALTEPAHLVGLAVALLALIFVDYRLAVLAIAAAAELFYLLVFARSSAYARRVRMKEIGAASEQQEADLATRAAELRRDERKRYREIEKLHQEVVALVEQTSIDPNNPHVINRKELDQLKAASLDFCLALQTFRGNLKKSPPEALRQELVQLESQTGGETSAQEARRQTAELLTKRIAHLSNLEEQMGALNDQLQVIEQTFKLMREQLSTLGAPGELRTDVGALVREVEATRETVRELSVFQVEGVVRTLR